ncbi:hypothetical protein STEG23_005517 [Scotinomys teguina]
MPDFSLGRLILTLLQVGSFKGNIARAEDNLFSMDKARKPSLKADGDPPRMQLLTYPGEDVEARIPKEGYLTIPLLLLLRCCCLLLLLLRCAAACCLSQAIAADKHWSAWLDDETAHIF